VRGVIEGFELRPLMLERPEGTFHDGIVAAATGATHRAGNVKSVQSLLVVVAGVLRASITVMKQAVRVRLPRFNSVRQSRTDQRCGEAFRDRPAHNFAAEQVQYNSKVPSPPPSAGT